MAPIKPADSRQPSKDVSDMAPKNAAVGMEFVHDDKLQVFEKPSTASMVRQDAFMHHVGITQDDSAFGAHRRPRILRRVAVIRENAKLSGKRIAPANQVLHLIIGQRFSRVEIESARIR